MKIRCVAPRALACVAASFAAVCPVSANAGSFKTIYTFQQGVDGGYPFSGLVPGPNGSFFGTSSGAGNAAPYGVVFQLSPPAAGTKAWVLKPIYSFSGLSDGAYPFGVVSGPDGALYGATGGGGTNNAGCGSGAGNGCGTVFELTPPAAGQTAWSFKLLHSFTRGLDGAFPVAPPVVAADGVLYGSTEGGGKCAGQTYGCGVVYRLVPPSSASGAWKETTLHAFAAGLDGSNPKGALVIGKNGVLYGTTTKAGISNISACATGSGCGTVFSLTPPAAGATVWKEATLYRFTGTIGANSLGGVTLDASGNLYGTAHSGGKFLICPEDGIRNAGCGTVFEISPPATGTKWTGTLLYAFRDGRDGSRPWDAPLLVNGTLYLSSSGDEVKTDGSIIKLTPPAAGSGGWTETTLYTFLDNTDSDDPVGGLLLSGGVLYGTALGDDAGPAPAGTIFSVNP
jgi:uncharacterized protein YceK